jgi:hypothetical protein
LDIEEETNHKGDPKKNSREKKNNSIWRKLSTLRAISQISNEMA